MNNSNMRRLLIILVIVLAVVLAAGVVMLVSLLNDNPQQTQPTDPVLTTRPADTTEDTIQSTQDSSQTTEPIATTEETTAPTTEAPDDVKIETPYGTLYYPGEWGDFLEVQENGNTYTFYSNVTAQKQQKLFSLTFGGGTDGALGILQDEAGHAVALHVQSYKFTPDDSWTDRECNIVFTMMDLLNDLLSRLPLEPVPEATQPPATEPSATEPVEDDRKAMGIDTAYCQLTYPAEWTEYLKLDSKQDSIAFYCVNAEGKQLPLFTIYFGGDQGTAAKTIRDYNGNSVEVRVDVQELNPDSTWTDADRRIARSMQEDLNYLLEKLK